MTENHIYIRQMSISDVGACVNCSYIKRREYEKAQPQFWKYAGGHAEQSQAKYFEELLSKNEYIMLVAGYENKIVGFIIGKLMNAPDVYDPGGQTLMIDDFCVLNSSDWNRVGTDLINEIKKDAKEKGAVQIVVVSGAHDEPKRSFLMNNNLNLVSEWYAGSIE